MAEIPNGNAPGRIVEMQAVMRDEKRFVHVTVEYEDKPPATVAAMLFEPPVMIVAAIQPTKEPA